MHRCKIISMCLKVCYPTPNKMKYCETKLLITAYEHDEAVVMNHAQA